MQRNSGLQEPCLYHLFSAPLYFYYYTSFLSAADAVGDIHRLLVFALGLHACEARAPFANFSDWAMARPHTCLTGEGKESRKVPFSRTQQPNFKL